ncbi:MAG: Na/Pi cotransporter family protein [Oscillospiraceae bacterium]|nr:Na/Pi cotransporter family protein [Oscillospiraceae bacterium]
MSIFDVLSLGCGLALFLYGMEVMGDALKRSAGNSLKTILGKMTSNPVTGFLLGLGVTAVIQSSSATTVMVVGFVNSGTMTLMQAAGVIMGANVGTAVTSWLTGMSSLGAGAESALDIIRWFKPSSWMPILALVGICLIMFAKRNRQKDVGSIMLGFSVLMVGMDMMSDSVGALAESESFRNILIMFENPVLGVLAGLVLTAIVQSSSASVGILQSLTTTGAITYGAAIPIVMGQNIGTCVTAMLSSISANRNGKRAAIVHLYFNIIGVVVWLAAFSIADAILDFAFVDAAINMWGRGRYPHHLQNSVRRADGTVLQAAGQAG